MPYIEEGERKLLAKKAKEEEAAKKRDAKDNELQK
jgi:hypothetical protein